MSFAIDKYRSEDRPLKLYRTTPLSAEVNKSQCFAVDRRRGYEREKEREKGSGRTSQFAHDNKARAKAKPRASE